MAIHMKTVTDPEEFNDTSWFPNFKMDDHIPGPEEWDNPRWIADHMIRHGQWMSRSDYKYQFTVKEMHRLAGADADKFDKTLPALMDELRANRYIKSVKLEDNVIWMEFDRELCVDMPCDKCEHYAYCKLPAKKELPEGKKLYDVAIRFKGEYGYCVVATSREEAEKTAMDWFSGEHPLFVANSIDEITVDDAKEIDPDQNRFRP